MDRRYEAVEVGGFTSKREQFREKIGVLTQAGLAVEIPVGRYGERTQASVRDADGNIREIPVTIIHHRRGGIIHTVFMPTERDMTRIRQEVMSR